MKFTLKQGTDISESDLADHPVWSSFYEPDELDLLKELEFDLDEVKGKLRGVESIDDYWFPLPYSAASMPFKYLYLSAQVKTPQGTNLWGYRTRVSLTVIVAGKRFHLNKAAKLLSVEQAKKLSGAIEEQNIFPLRVYIEALDKHEEFTM